MKTKTRSNSLTNAALAAIVAVAIGVTGVMPIHADELTDRLATFATQSTVLTLEVSSGRDFETQEQLTPTQINSKQDRLDWINAAMADGLKVVLRSAKSSDKAMSAAQAEINPQLRAVIVRFVTLQVELRSGLDAATERPLNDRELQVRRDALHEIKQNFGGVFVTFINAVRKNAQEGS